MKKLLTILAALSLTFALAGCKTDPEPEPDPDPLTCEEGQELNDAGDACVDIVVEVVTVAFSGLENASVEIDGAFDVLEGVSVLGSDGVDYSDNIMVDSENCIIGDDNLLDTSAALVCIIDYRIAQPAYKMVSIEVEITLPDLGWDTVGPILTEWHFDSEAELADWNIYAAGGGAIEMSLEDGAMKLVTASGGQRFETRLDTQGLMLQKDYYYVVRLSMKSDIDGKKVHLNFGELLPSDPWFTPFKPEGVDILTLSTEWQTFDILFPMGLDNQNGGPLFEMGNMEGSEGLDATIWVDDIYVKGGSDEDMFGPVLTGVEDMTIYVEDVYGDFDILAGVMAVDNVDGDITANIITSGDAVDTTVAGAYFVSYVIFDSSFNSTRVERWITVLEDTVGPEVLGLDAVVVQINNAFDPLEGVTASDARDGDLTADIVLGGDVLDLTTAGTYVLEYTVSDAAGNETVATRTVTVSAMIWNPTDLVTNGTFDLNPFYVWAADWNTTSVTTTFDGTAAILDIADVGTENWNIQFVQEGFALVENKQYRLTFDAMSTVARDMNVKIIAEDGTEFTTTVMITDTMTTYTVDVTFAHVDSAAKLSIELGGALNGITTAVASVVTFDNLLLEEFDGTAVVADTDQMVNGDFALTNLTGWSSWAADWFDPSIGGVLTSEWNELVYRYDSAGDESWNHQINFDGIAFEYGQTYKVSFDAKSDLARDFQVNIYDGQMGHASGALALLEDTFASYEFVFTYMGDEEAKIELQLGKLTENFAGTAFYLDNVKIEMLEQSPILLNGMFDYVGWSTWSADWVGLSSSVAIVNQELVYTFNGGVGDQSWMHQLNFDNLNFTPGTEYKIMFDAKADVARDFIVNVWDAANSIGHDSLALTLSTEFQAFEHMFTYDALADTVAKIEMKFGLVTAGDAGSMFYLDNIVVVEWDSVNGVAVGENMIVNSTFDQPVEWGAWYGDEWSGTTSSTTTVVDGAMVVDVVLDASAASYATQIYQENLAFRQGVTYTVQFDASATVARDVLVNLGEPFVGAPYFVNFTPTEQFTLGTDVATYSFTFTMSENNLNGKLVFELGTIDGVSTDAVVTIDNVQIFENYNPQN